MAGLRYTWFVCLNGGLLETITAAEAAVDQVAAVPENGGIIMDYGKTLNLPKTDFPMRGNLPQREPEILKQWQEADIYKKRLARNEGHEKFVLHDGPPYANGGIHLGTALNKVLKDIVIRYYDMKGYYSPYVPGWDTHGLPTENRAIDELGLNRHEVGPVKFRQACE